MKFLDENNKIPIVSFFSGGGFLDMGFEKAGFNVIFSNEIDEDFAQFYKEGMSSWSGEQKEISLIADIREVPLTEIKQNIRDPFGIIGGPPCQDFSTQGSKNGFNGLRGTLTYHFYDLIMDLQPTFFLIENVPGLALLRKTQKTFNKLLDQFREDYLISVAKLNALHYGVPQNRKRLFVLGARKSHVKDKSLNILDDSWFDWPVPSYNNAEASYNWGELEGKDSKLEKRNLPPPPKNLCIESILLKKDEEENTPNAEEYIKLRNTSKAQKILEGDTYRPSFKRLHRQKYSPTACYGNNEVHLHPVHNRRLSVRETLRVQGVPDSYVLSTQGKLTKKFKMIGNGVPVPLAHQIALSIKDFLISL